MSLVDYRSLTLAQLQTIRDNAVTAINRVLTGAQKGAIGNSRSFEMPQLKDLRQTLSEVSAEIANRSDAGGDFILASFGEPQ